MARMKGVKQMKPQDPKNYKLAAALFPFAVGALLILCAGCNTISYKCGDTEVSCKRAFWNTESYSVEFGTNGVAKLDVNKSGVDTAALNGAITAVISAATAVK